MIDYEDEDEILHVFTPAPGRPCWAAGFDYLHDEVLRNTAEFRLTVSQMVEMFGVDNVPEDIQQMLAARRSGALGTSEVIGHAIEPNFAINASERLEHVGVVPGGFTWREVLWIRGAKDAKPLGMAGFHQQPFATSRWNTQGNDPYGRGVGEYMLGDTISLQLATRQQAESIEKVNRPPMGADVSLQNLPASTNPGKITYFNTGTGGEKKFWPLYQTSPDIAAITAYINTISERIKRTAYNDVFQIIQNLRETTKAEVTATEIDALREEAAAAHGTGDPDGSTPLCGRACGVTWRSWNGAASSRPSRHRCAAFRPRSTSSRCSPPRRRRPAPRPSPSSVQFAGVISGASIRSARSS